MPEPGQIRPRSLPDKWTVDRGPRAISFISLIDRQTMKSFLNIFSLALISFSSKSFTNVYSNLAFVLTCHQCLYVYAMEDVVFSEEDEFLAEILAEEQREAEEMHNLENEMKELDEMRAQHERMHQSRSGNKMKPGNTSGIPGASSQKLGTIEDELKRKEAEKQEKERNANKTAEDEAEKRKADEIARKREEAYQAELARINDEKLKKSLQRQKKKDGQIVKKILRNSANEKHYSVLGLRCKWGEIELPFGVKFCSTSPGDIKKAYRTIAKTVHPDKNRDGRANEAFDAIERSAAILMDKDKKRAYDLKLARKRKVAVEKAFVTVKTAFVSLKRTIKLLGPFATPVLILVALII